MAETYIDIMLQSLRKKLQVLDCIIKVNRTQKEQLEDPSLHPDDFDKTVEEKSALIAQLEQLDSGFEKLFERTKEELDGNKEKYASQIKEMQDCIRRITDKSVEIQAQEARNKDLMTKKFAMVRQQAKSVRTSARAASQYYKNMSGTGVVDPQFLDGKQ